MIANLCFLNVKDGLKPNNLLIGNVLEYLTVPAKVLVYGRVPALLPKPAVLKIIEHHKPTSYTVGK